MFEDPDNEEICLGSVELDRKEFKNPKIIGRKMGLTTLRIGKISPLGAKIKIDKNNNVYESYGTAPIFIGKKEFEEFKNSHPTIKTIRDLFTQVVNC